MICWRIAEKSICLLSNGSELPRSWATLFLDFQETDIDLNRLDATIHASPSTEWSDVSRFHIESSHDSRSDEHLISIDIPFSTGTLEKKRNRYHGEFVLDSRYSFGLYATLRIALALLVEDSGGLLLHASGVWRDNRVWVFCGPSGAGKTTIATELHGGGKMFSEDETVIGFDEQKTLMAFTTPFGDSTKYRKPPKVGPAAAIIDISQFRENELTIPTTLEAIKTLMQQSQWYFRTGFFGQRALDNITSVLSTKQLLGLKFRKDNGFWPLLDQWECGRTERRTTAQQ